MTEALLKGITLGLLLSISVGPVLFSIIKQSLNSGIRGGIAFVTGVFFSEISLVLISNVFTELFTRLSNMQRELGIIGSIFLISMGIYTLLFKKVTVSRNNDKAPTFKFRKRDYARIFFSGYFMNILNPALFLFWIWASSTVAHQSVQHRIIVFTTCLLFMLTADIAKVFLADKIRTRLTHGNIQLINKINGIILIGFGLALIYGTLFL